MLRIKGLFNIKLKYQQIKNPNTSLITNSKVLTLQHSVGFFQKSWKPILFWAACLILSMQQVFATDSGKWEKLILVPGYFGKGINAYPNLTDSEKIMIDSLGNLPYQNKTMVVIQEKGEYFCFIRCFHGVFRWNGEKWALFSGGKVTGYNCSSYEFFQNGKMYQFSGRGYWQSNSDLFSFGENRPIEFVRTINQPADYYGWLKFKTDRGVFSVFGIIDYDKSQTIHLDPEGYFLDIQTLTWKKSTFDFNDKMKELIGNNLLDQEYRLGGVVETQDYALLEIIFAEYPSLVWLIFDKHTSRIYGIKTPKFFFEKSQWIQTEGNLVRFLTEESFDSRTIDLSEQVKSASLVGILSVSDGKSVSEIFSQEWLLWIAEGVLVFLVLWLIWRLTQGNFKKQSAQSSEPNFDFPNQFSSWLKELSPYSGQLISQAQLEAILGLENLQNQDLKKVRRSRAIKALNEYMKEHHGKPIILRIRDEQDMRIIRYRIEDFSLTKHSKATEPMI